jgi:hypothetical protein
MSGLVITGPDTPPIPEPSPIKAQPDVYRGTTVDTRYTPSSALITAVEGSPRTVNWYSQVLDKDSELNGQNLSKDAIYQSYRAILGMELKVTSEDSHGQDDKTKVTTRTGSANIYPFLIPNKGDLFTADIGDGREGVFKVVASRKNSIFKETTYAIDYELLDYNTDVRRADLEAKTIQTYYFRRDFLMHGQNPLLLKEDAALAEELEEWYGFLTTNYCKTFFSRQFSTMLIPGQVGATYDPFATKAIRSIFTTREAPELISLRILNVNEDDALRATTLWDALLTRQREMMMYVNRQVGLVSARSFIYNPMLNGIFHSGILRLVYLTDPELSIDNQIYKNVKPVSGDTLADVPSRAMSIEVLEKTYNLDGLPYEKCPLIHPVLIDDHYIFSKAFYDRAETGQSKLELLTQDYLDQKAPNNRLLLAMCKSQHAWGGLERFYYLPVLIMLLKASLRYI